MDKQTKVIVSAETSKYERNIKRLAAFDAKATREMRHRWSKVKTAMKGASVAALAFGTAFAFAMKKSIDAASDLEETASKFAVVFAGQTEQAERHAQALVDSYAMSTREAKQYLSSVQDLLVPMGMQANAAGMLSNEIVKLSADLGSFNNLPTAQVMGDIQSALVGNFETMKKYGVVLNATIVQEEALAMGLAKTKDELTAGHKAQAAYALMVEGSKAAIGDMERTSGSYANQMRKLHANIEDFTAQIGEDLLPIVTVWIEKSNEWFKQNEKTAKQVSEFAENVLVLATAIGGATGKAIEFSNVWVKTWQALGLAAAGQTTYTEALLVGANVVDDFNEKLEKQNEHLQANKDMLGVAASVTAPPALTAPMGGDMTSSDAEKFAEIQSLKTESWYIELEKRWAMEEAFAGKVHALQQRQLSEEQAIAAAKHEMAVSQGMAALSNAQFVFAELGKKNKAAFQVFKAFAIAETVIKTYEAAQGAYSALAGIPIVGPSLAVAAAAAAMAAGMARVSMITAMQPGGGAGGGGGGGGGAVGTYPASPTTGLPEFPELDEAGERRGSVTININGPFIGDEAYIDDLVERINDAGDREVFINQTLYADELSP